MTTCRISYCDDDATVLVTLDRTESPAVREDFAWHGHHETAYCGKHAIERPSAEGIERYGDMWTMKPLVVA